MIVEFVLAAEWEFNDAVAYFDLKRPGLGTEFARDVDRAVQRIVENPQAWQALPGGMRRCRLRRFEYGLVYRVRGDVATIYAVMHLKRKPGYWRKRK
jgi:ParE toxin of type II toxin-antitoxin system, parDE